MVILLDLVERGEGWKIVLGLVGPRNHWDRWLGHDANVGVGLAVSFPVIVILAAHLRIFLNLLPTSFAACHGTAHGAGHHATEGDQDSGGENNVSSPRHVRDEEEDVDQEGQQANEEGDDKEDEKDEEVSCRV